MVSQIGMRDPVAPPVLFDNRQARTKPLHPLKRRCNKTAKPHHSVKLTCRCLSLRVIIVAFATCPSPLSVWFGSTWGTNCSGPQGTHMYSVTVKGNSDARESSEGRTKKSVRTNTNNLNNIDVRFHMLDFPRPHNAILFPLLMPWSIISLTSLFWSPVPPTRSQPPQSDLAHVSSCTWLLTNPTSLDHPCCVSLPTVPNTSRPTLLSINLFMRCVHWHKPLNLFVHLNSNLDLHVRTIVVWLASEETELFLHEPSLPNARFLQAKARLSLYEAFLIRLFHQRDQALHSFWISANFFAIVRHSRPRIMSFQLCLVFFSVLNFPAPNFVRYTHLALFRASSFISRLMQRNIFSPSTAVTILCLRSSSSLKQKSHWGFSLLSSRVSSISTNSCTSRLCSWLVLPVGYIQDWLDQWMM